MISKKRAKILAISRFLPKRAVSNHEIAEKVETTDEWIVTRTGIRSRRIAEEGESTLSLGLKAAENLFSDGRFSKAKVGLVIFATMTPDFLTPATASLLQEALGLSKAGAYDMQVACSGFIYAIAQAKAFVESALYEKVLVVAAEKMSSVIDFTDRSTCILFGDGAAAALIGLENKGLALDISSIELGSDGKMSSLIQIPAGGSRSPVSTETLSRRDHFLKMEGGEVFKHAVRRMAEATETLLEKSGVSMNEIAWVVPHQANRRIIEALAKQFSIPMDRFFLNLEKYGNTSGASVGIALSELTEQHRLKKGEKVLLVAFGAGLAWGSALLEQGISDG